MMLLAAFSVKKALNISILISLAVSGTVIAIFKKIRLWNALSQVSALLSFQMLSKKSSEVVK